MYYVLGTGIKGINKIGHLLWKGFTDHLSAKSHACYKRKTQGAREQIRESSFCLGPHVTFHIQVKEPLTISPSTWSRLGLVPVWLGPAFSILTLLILLLPWHQVAGEFLFYPFSLPTQDLGKQQWLLAHQSRTGQYQCPAQGSVHRKEPHRVNRRATWKYKHLLLGLTIKENEHNKFPKFIWIVKLL